MSIIKCPECKNRISDKAAFCPKCGLPNPFANISDDNSKNKKEEYEPGAIIFQNGEIIIPDSEIIERLKKQHKEEPIPPPKYMPNIIVGNILIIFCIILIVFLHKYIVSVPIFFF